MGSYLLNVLLQLLLLLLWPVAATTTSALNNSSSVAMPGCQEICGNTTIPYPFGIGDASCFRQGPFELTCDETQIPPLWAGRQGVLEISLQGQLRTGSSLTHDCYNSSGFVSRYNPNLDSYGFTFSDTDNRFTVLGCDTVASISDYPYGLNFSSGCSLTCTKENVVSNGSCTIGCCQTSIPKGYNNFNVSITSNNNHRDVLSFNPCGYAFLIEKDSLQFSPSYLQGYLSATSVLPVVLDWAIEWTTTGNRSCQNEPNYACGSNSYCHVSKNDRGYSCNCSSGYQGNPYLLPQGCQDINECKDPLLNNCSLHSVCNNLPGSYNCSCALGYEGDGRRNGKGCTPSKKSILIPVAIASVLGGLGLSFLLFGSMWLHKVLKKRRKNKLKQKFFQRNGGFLLQQQISSERDNIEKTKMFSEEELQKATDNYNENRILGQGGQGTVYKGMLLDGRIVAVKKSEGLHDEGRIEQFINEVVILSEINHRNVVKLFGCCLETEVPLLVYEFISNGTVFSCIHDKSGEFSFTWDSRLRIAIEVAGALAYLHSAASIPIYHRDIKSTNILLDDRYRAKVSDFGISRSVPIDRTHITTLVQGTFGYLDPEYFQSSQFTEKSDVYSFGVVLVELLTGEKPFSSTRPQEKKSLVSYFISSMEENSFFEILDAQVVKEGKKEDLEAVVVLAYRCLNMNGKKRPTMKEVAMALEVLRASPSDHDQILFAQEIKQEDDCVITQPIGLWDTSSISTTSWTMETRATIPVDHQPLLLNISS